MEFSELVFCRNTENQSWNTVLLIIEILQCVTLYKKDTSNRLLQLKKKPKFCTVRRCISCFSFSISRSKKYFSALWNVDENLYSFSITEFERLELVWSVDGNLYPFSITKLEWLELVWSSSVILMISGRTECRFCRVIFSGEVNVKCSLTFHLNILGRSVKSLFGKWQLQIWSTIPAFLSCRLHIKCNIQ